MFANDYKEVHKKYKNLIHKVVNKYPSMYEEDLYQEACIALDRARLTWHAKGNANFLTWAYICMDHACSNYMHRYASSLRVPQKCLDSFEGCISLDSEVFENTKLDSIVGSEPILYDDTMQVVNKMFRSLVHKGILSSSDLDLLYLRYFDNLTLEALSNFYELTPSGVGRKIRSILYKIRPYFIRSLSKQFICL